MNKQLLLQCILEKLRHEADVLKHAAQTAHKDATDEESQAEHKYDTRGLEASYLAGAQANMAAEVLGNIKLYEGLQLRNFSESDIIALTALIELEDEKGNSRLYFLGPKSGGTKISYEGSDILLITPSSPMGRELMGREIGDVIKVTTGSNIKEYEIVSIR